MLNKIFYKISILSVLLFGLIITTGCGQVFKDVSKENDLSKANEVVTEPIKKEEIQEKEKIVTTEIIILGNEYKIPKIYLENNEPKGILVDIMKYVDSKMENHEFLINLYPWARAYQNAVSGKGAIIGLSMTEERLNIFDYSDVVYYDDVIMVVLKGKEFNYSEIKDLQGKIIGIGREGTFGDEYEEAKSKGILTVEEDGGPVHRLKKILLGRIDVALISPGKFALDQTISLDEELIKNKDNFVIIEKPFKQDPNYLGISKSMNMQEFIDQFNEEVKKGYENGAIPKIIEQYE